LGAGEKTRTSERTCKIRGNELPKKNALALIKIRPEKKTLA